MSLLYLTGWQQPADALSILAPDAQHFDYAAYDNVEDMFAALPKTPRLPSAGRWAASCWCARLRAGISSRTR